MQYSKLKLLLKGRLSRFSSSTSLDSWINLELNAAMDELEGDAFLPWFLWAKNQGMTLPINTSTAVLPSDFLRQYMDDSGEAEESYMVASDIVDVYTGSGITPKLVVTRMEENPIVLGLIGPTVARGPVGPPTRYYVDEDTRYIYFDHWADKEYLLMFSYMRASPRYTDTPANSEEPLWAKHAPAYLIATVGLRIATFHIKNAGASQMFMADAQRERTKLIYRHNAIMEARITANIGN